MADQNDSTSGDSKNELPNTEAQGQQSTEAGKDEVKGKVEPSQVKETYTKAEVEALETGFKERYGGLDAKLTEVTKAGKQAAKELKQELADAKVAADERVRKAENTSFLESVQEKGGDMDMAKAIVAQKDTVATTAIEQAKRKAELDARDVIITEAGRGKLAQDLVAKYKLDSKVAEELLDCESPEQMKVKALTLQVEKLEAGAVPTQTTDSGEKGKAISVDKLSIITRLGMAAEGKL